MRVRDSARKLQTNLLVMAKKRRPKRLPKLARPWPLSLAAMAAAATKDGGVGLSLLLFDAGFFERPQMKIVIRRVAA